MKKELKEQVKNYLKGAEKRVNKFDRKQEKEFEEKKLTSFKLIKV